ncbi:MAG: cytochrome c [Hyphomonadaceae bacterium]|nr:cytochrome c [Hyphomonadaceae bacterium]
MARWLAWSALIALIASVSGCVASPCDCLPRDAALILPRAQAIAYGETPPPLPLRIPIKGVMAGIIDFSAHGVFTLAISDKPLTDSDWTAAGLASINLIGSASLITLPGSGPDDADWIATPEWQVWAKTFQQASITTAIAIRGKNQAGFLAAANTLADACQSCHSRFRTIGRPDASEMASKPAPAELAAFVRAWPSSRALER